MEPVSTGMPSSQPTCTEDQWNTEWSTRKVTSTPFIIHAAKHRVNAIVFKVNMRCDLPVAFSIMFIVLRS